MNEGAPPDPPEFEPSDASPRVVAVIASSLGVLVVVGLAAGLALVHPWETGRQMTVRPSPDFLFQNGPASHTSVDQSWDDYQREVRSHLGGYGWVDRGAGIVRIPLDRAIDLECEGASPAGIAKRELRSAP